MLEDHISDSHIGANNRYASAYLDGYRVIVTQLSLNIFKIKAVISSF